TINIGLSNSFVTRPFVPENKKYDIIFFLRREEWKRPHLLKDILLVLKDKYNFKPSVLAVSQDRLLLEEYSEFLNASISPKDDSELIESIDSSRLLLFTSSKEGFGLPPLECMSRGLPAIIFECGGPNIYAEHEQNAFIVNDKIVAADYIFTILHDAGLYNKISVAAKETAISFSNEKGFSEFNSLLNDIAQNNETI
ncbi:TPA: glycosyltransferase, partial [Klebsiella pneumoniae subsp. pneumoniae]|nr:glycosyltransferase [Klebsiella pneumoniae subsp. pneumoniae]